MAKGHPISCACRAAQGPTRSYLTSTATRRDLGATSPRTIWYVPTEHTVSLAGEVTESFHVVGRGD